jgi:UDP-GlcNAc:undecaprenyl-phosphate/decaprenyl-phosphate GlcNAc-1-phosphate transferase
MIWLLAFFVSLTVSLVATRAVMAIGISDSPNADRKLHRQVTPTSGGLGIMAGFSAGLAVLVIGDQVRMSLDVVCLVAVCFVGGILGLLDDLYVLGPKRKLFVMLIATAAFVVMGARIVSLKFAPNLSVSLGPIIGGIGTVFWLLVIVNTINFMDGANGLSMGCSAISLFSLGVLGFIIGEHGPILLAFIGAGACLGFLRWNAVTGRIFAGDSGALFVGLLCGTTGVWLVTAGANPLGVALCFIPSLVDVILTVLRRAKHREKILQPHSQHAYQALIRAGVSHAVVARRYWLYTFVCCFGACLGQAQGGSQSLIYFAIFLGFFCFMHFAMLKLAKDAIDGKLDDDDDD